MQEENLYALTTQGKREAENLKNINAQLRADNYMAPLCADVHFNANVADVAALYAERFVSIRVTMSTLLVRSKS